MVRKGILIFALFLLFSLVAGCWSRNEIESIAIIEGMGIDVTKVNGQDKFMLTVNILRPSLAGGGPQSGGGSRGMPIYWRTTVIGETLSDAERSINLRIPRRVFYGHIRFVLISEEAARQGLTDIIDYLHRNRRIRPRILILLTDNKASEKLNNFSELETTIARQVQEMNDISASMASKVFIKDLLVTTDELITPGLDPIIAKIVTVDSPPTEPGGAPIPVFRFIGGGAFRVDKFVGWVDADETRGYLMATGKAQQGAFPFTLQSHPTADVNINMTRASGKIKVNANGQKVTANIEIRAEGDLSEYHKTNKILTDKGIKLLEKKFAEQIEKEVMKSVEKSKKLKSDYFGFGAVLYRSNPKAWENMEKQWYEILPKMTVRVKVVANIRRTGMISEPFKPR